VVQQKLQYPQETVRRPCLSDPSLLSECHWNQIFDVLKKEGIVSEKNIIIFTASLVDQKEIDRLLESGAK
jgi:hypothetical protein